MIVVIGAIEEWRHGSIIEKKNSKDSVIPWEGMNLISLMSMNIKSRYVVSG